MYYTSGVLEEYLIMFKSSVWSVCVCLLVPTFCNEIAFIVEHIPSCNTLMHKIIGVPIILQGAVISVIRASDWVP